MLVKEAPGGIIIFDRQLSAGETIIARRDIDQRDSDPRRRLVKVADLDFKRLIGPGRSAQGKECADTKQKPEQIHLPCDVQIRHVTRLHRNISPDAIWSSRPCDQARCQRFALFSVTFKLLYLSWGANE